MYYAARIMSFVASIVYKTSTAVQKFSRRSNLLEHCCVDNVVLLPTERAVVHMTSSISLTNYCCVQKEQLFDWSSVLFP